MTTTPQQHPASTGCEHSWQHVAIGCARDRFPWNLGYQNHCLIWWKGWWNPLGIMKLFRIIPLNQVAGSNIYLTLVISWPCWQFETMGLLPMGFSFEYRMNMDERHFYSSFKLLQQPALLRPFPTVWRECPKHNWGSPGKSQIQHALFLNVVWLSGNVWNIIYNIL